MIELEGIPSLNYRRFIANIQEVEAELSNVRHIDYDSEATSADAQTALYIGASFGYERADGAYRAFYVPISHVSIERVDFFLVAPGNDPYTFITKPSPINSSKKDVLLFLEKLFNRQDTLIGGHNLQYDFRLFLEEYKRNLNKLPTIRCKIADTIVSSTLKHDEKRGLKDRALLDFKFKMAKFLDTVDPRLWQSTAIEKFGKYACDDVYCARQLYKHHMSYFLSCEKGERDYRKDKIWLNSESLNVPILATMETLGCRINVDRLASLTKEFEVELEEIEREIYTIFPWNKSIRSSKDISNWCFKNKIWDAQYSQKKSETSKYLSVDGPVLKKIVYHEGGTPDGIRLAKLLLDHRQLTKLITSFMYPIKENLDEDERIHTHLNQIFVVTGRLSSSNLNLQQIPSRSERGKKIRELFIARDGFTILCADYSQMEVRILGHRANVQTLIAAFASGQDVHSFVTSTLFDIPIEDVKPAQRTIGKELNLGIGYGMGSAKLADKLKCTGKEAREHIKVYYDRLSEIKSYKESVEKFVRNHGYSTTLFGRTRSFRRELAKEKTHGYYWANEALNSTIQGSAGDIIKFAQVKVVNRLLEEGLLNKHVFLTLQIHDELMFEVRKGMEEEVKQIVKEEMESAANMIIALEVDVKYGDTWKDAH